MGLAKDGSTLSPLVAALFLAPSTPSVSDAEARGTPSALATSPVITHFDTTITTGIVIIICTTSLVNYPGSTGD